MVASSIFMKVMFGESFVPCFVKMNRAIQAYNNKHDLSCPIRIFSNADFLCCMALMIGSACYASNGKALWKQDNNPEYGWLTIEPATNFGRWVKLYRFKEFRQFLASIYVDPARQNTDLW